MECCNKDEASKLKLIAEQKLNENDFDAAKEFALKAQALYPGMDGLSQLMILINIYVYAEEKVGKCGEVDWYGVLGVTPTADDETIKKQYHKIALMIHPDKNKNSRADGAFKLVLEAWNLLSDKAKRRAYDQRRWIRSVPPHVRSDHIFLTDCGTCQKRQELHRVFQGKVVICCHCGQPFKANQISPLRLINFHNVKSLPCGTSTNDELFHGAFVAKCQTCNTLQKQLRIYEGKTILCSYCCAPFQADNVSPHINMPSWMDKDPTLSTIFSDCETCRTRHKLHRKLLGMVIVCSHCRQPFKVSVSAIRLGNSSVICPLPSGSEIKELIYGTFVTECPRCMVHQKQLKIYEGKTINCSCCDQSFQANASHQQTNNVGMKRAREEPRGAVGGGWDRRDNVRARAS